MRILLALVSLVICIAWSFSFISCGSSSDAPFCDTTCNNDTLRFSANHPDNPFVTIGMKNCLPDTVTWSHDRLLAKRKLLFSDFTGKEVRINQKFVQSFFKDTSYVWLMFNDCITAQGFLVKIPFSKSGSIFRKNSAFNSLDPKFSVAGNLAAYTDKGNVFVEDMTTGKQATMTFGRMVENMDYTDIHKTVDSVNITPERVWIKLKIDNEWQTMEKKISLQ